MVEAIREVIAETGQALTRPDAHGQHLQRFGGHSLRVAGAQMLAAAGIPLQLIQLLGRWTSMAIQRYTQDAALAVVPDVTTHVLGEEDVFSNLAGLGPNIPLQPHPAGDVGQRPPPTPTSSADIEALQRNASTQQAQVSRIQTELQKLQEAVTKPQYAFVKRVRSPIVHIGSTVELSNPPRRWRSKCGWSYGVTNFLRVAEIVTPLRKCKKCFEMGNSSSSDDSQDSDGSRVSDTSSSSDS